ncbi:MAG: hypothetical protein IJN30_01190 [Bacteroidales bacterium]|nr:hypothetical protein [Bacteroidales bacterium]MBQ8854549.1 hypothetical protein [Bacteroidales bacterium]
MKLKSIVLLSFALLASMVSGVKASAQQNQGPDIYEQVQAETDRLQRVLDLEDWQAFYVDSTLTHDFTAMMAEYEKLQGSKVTNTSMYQAVQDKWMDQIDATYRKIFTDDQWKAYLKAGAGRLIKAREKRKAKAAGN